MTSPGDDLALAIRRLREWRQENQPGDPVLEQIETDLFVAGAGLCEVARMNMASLGAEVLRMAELN